MPVSWATMAPNVSSVRPVCRAGVVPDRFEAEHPLSFGADLQSQQPEVDLEDGEVPVRPLDHHRLPG